MKAMWEKMDPAQREKMKDKFPQAYHDLEGQQAPGGGRLLGDAEQSKDPVKRKASKAEKMKAMWEKMDPAQREKMKDKFPQAYHDLEGQQASGGGRLLGDA